jgi:hypothetical protein
VSSTSQSGRWPGPGQRASSCPLASENLSRSKTGLAGDLLIFRASGGARVFVDQSAQDRFRRICCVSMPVTVAREASGSSSGTRWAMPWCGRAGLYCAWYSARTARRCRSPRSASGRGVLGTGCRRGARRSRSSAEPGQRYEESWQRWPGTRVLRQIGQPDRRRRQRRWQQRCTTADTTGLLAGSPRTTSAASVFASQAMSGPETS